MNLIFRRSIRTLSAERSAAILTLILGIVPFALLATLSDTIWFTSRCDVPLLAVPSVWIGDSVFLPLLNYRIVAFVRSLLALEPCPALSGFVLKAIVIGFAASAAVNGYTHYLWTRDEYLGFIDTQRRRLSPAGWWHYGFSTVQSAIIFVTVCLWIRLRRKSTPRDYRLGLDAWSALAGYSLLSLLDFTINHLYILPRHAEPYSNTHGWQGLLVIPFTFSGLLLNRIAQTRRCH